MNLSRVQRSPSTRESDLSQCVSLEHGFISPAHSRSEGSSTTGKGGKGMNQHRPAGEPPPLTEEEWEALLRETPPEA